MSAYRQLQDTRNGSASGSMSARPSAGSVVCRVQTSALRLELCVDLVEVDQHACDQRENQNHTQFCSK